MASTSQRGLNLRWLMLAACLALATAPALMAQSQGTGQIVGTVFDSTGAAVPGAKVTATGKATGLVRELETNEAGMYRFVLLPPGAYTVSVKHTGFKNAKSDINVSVGSAVTVDFRLQLGEVSEVVEVTASVLIETTAVQTDALINNRSISELPINGRRFQDFVTLTPTVQIEPSRNGISFSGQRGINSNVTIDGADYNQPFFGGIRGGERSNQAFSIPQEAIKEFQIVPYGYSAEFGRSSSGVMNAVTKSGSNDWHGSAFWYVRHKDMAHRDAFNRSALDRQDQFGGSLGGPVIRDRTRVFGAYEQQRLRQPRTVIFRNLDTSSQFPVGRTAFNAEAFDFYTGLEGPYNETNDAWTVLGKLDQQLTTNHSVAVRYHWSKNTAKNAVATGAPTVPETSAALSNNGTEGDEQHTITGSWTGIFTSRIVNELRAQYSRERRPRTANALQTGVNNSIGNYGTRNFLPTTQKDYRFQIADGLNWNIGRHSIKFGGDFNYLFADQLFAFNQFGIFTMSTPSGCSNPGAASPNGFAGWQLNVMSIAGGVDPAYTGACVDPANRFDSTGVFYNVAIGNGLADMSMRELAFFAQDSWRINSRVTLNFGLRWEGYWNPQPEANNSALVTAVRNFPFPIGKTVDPTFIPDNLNQWMPRVGIAWDPMGTGRTVFRANAGIYYARNPLLLFAGPLNNFRTPPGDVRVQLPFSLPTGYVCTPIAVGDTCNTVYWQMRRIGIDLNTLSLDQLPRLTPTQLQNIAANLGLVFDPNQGLQVTTWDNNYESPRSWQWNLSLQHEVARGLTIGGDFVYINTVHLQRNREFNLPAPLINPADGSQRPCFALRSATCTTGGFPLQARPIPSLTSMQVRESNSRALYRGFTWRASYQRSRYQFQAYYTYSFNYSDDDNERDAGGQSAVNAFALHEEYGFSRIDVRHNFVFNTVLDLPWGFTVGALSRMRSGRPIDPSTGSDSNGDFITNDRPFIAPGVPFKRNSFRDRAIYNVDLRAAKKFNLPREGMYINVTVDFFNLFNFDNVTLLPTGTRRTYGVGISSSGASVAPNTTFLQLYDPALCIGNNPTRGNKSCYDTVNTPGQPFLMQVGIRLQF